MSILTGQKKRIACIGGGAAGFFCALNIASARPDVEVIILEKTRQPLSKIKISGGGRCNVTHHCFDPQALSKNYPRGHDFLKKAFYSFQPKDMIAWLEERGVPVKVEPDGRMFPRSNTSSTIIECFLKEAQALGVKILLESDVTQIQPQEDGLVVHIRDRDPLLCDKVLLATGGNHRSYYLAEGVGHTPVSAVPSLFTFNIKDERLDGISGVSVPLARVSIDATDVETLGPLLITHWGLSGPAILRLSAWGARDLAERGYEAKLKVSWVGEKKDVEVKESLNTQRLSSGSLKVDQTPLFSLPKSLWKKLTEHAGIPLNRVFGQMTKKEMQSLYEALTCSIFHVTGKSTNKDEFVTAGGIPLSEIDLKTMQSKICPHLFFAGEVIDVDGITGGFNFQNAWTTAWIAARAMQSI